MAPTPAELATESVGLGVFFLIGVLGGAHCLGMCGPLVMTYVSRMDGGDDRVRWRDILDGALHGVVATPAVLVTDDAVGPGLVELDGQFGDLAGSSLLVVTNASRPLLDG